MTTLDPAFDPDATVRRPRPTSLPAQSPPTQAPPSQSPPTQTPPQRAGAPVAQPPAKPFVPPRPGLWTVVKQIFDKVIIEPIKDGYPEPKQWPRGLVPAVVLGSIGILVCAVMILASPWIREADIPIAVGGQQVIGSWSVGVLMWLSVLTLALGITANLHIHLVARFIVLPLLLTPFLSALAMSLYPPSAPAIGGAVAILGIVAFTVVRIGRKFAWFEFPVVLVLSTTAVFIPIGSGVFYSFDFRATVLLTMLVTFTTLAAPSLIVLGYSAAQVAVNLSEWTADRFNRMLEGPATIALALLLGAAAIWRGVDLTLAGDPSWTPAVWITSIIVLVVAVALSLGLLALRPDKGLHPVPPEALENSWTPLAYPLAFLIVPQLLVNLLAIHGNIFLTVFRLGSLEWLIDWTAGDTANSIMRLVSVGAALWLAVVRARRNDRITPVVLACYCTVMLVSAVRLVATGPLRVIWTIDALAVALVVLVFVMVTVLWIREGHREVIWKQVLLVSILATLFRFREPLSEPSMVFAGVSGTVVILLSLAWRVLTDGGMTRHDSAMLPRASRVLFFVTSILLSAVTLAWVAQTRIVGGANHAVINALGDHMLGKPLMMGAGICALIAIVGRLTDDDPGINRTGSKAD
ncbi:hypothetical protein ACPCG0_09360 [Propionibacteriaceae bacterium Y1923]